VNDSVATQASTDDQLLRLERLLGKTIGSLRLRLQLGAGAMGSVYLATDACGHRVAVKVPRRADRPVDAEACLTRLARHPNVVEVLDVLALPWGGSCLVMELLHGRPLSKLMRDEVPAGVALPILRQLCDAAGAAHRRGVVHCDLKPDNVFLVRRGGLPHFVKVIDWGIARGPGVAAPARGTVSGTPRYMSPEQARGHSLGPESDVYAIGLIAWQLLVGHYPFDGATPTRLLVQHRREVPPSPHTLRPRVPRAVSDAVMRALEKKPEQRFSTAAELGAALDVTAPPRRLAA
jgi:serine/threonine-protein kinase